MAPITPERESRARVLEHRAVEEQRRAQQISAEYQARVDQQERLGQRAQSIGQEFLSTAGNPRARSSYAGRAFGASQQYFSGARDIAEQGNRAIAQQLALAESFLKQAQEQRTIGEQEFQANLYLTGQAIAVQNQRRKQAAQQEAFRQEKQFAQESPYGGFTSATGQMVRFGEPKTVSVSQTVPETFTRPLTQSEFAQASIQSGAFPSQEWLRGQAPKIETLEGRISAATGFPGNPLFRVAELSGEYFGRSTVQSAQEFEKTFLQLVPEQGLRIAFPVPVQLPASVARPIVQIGILPGTVLSGLYGGLAGGTSRLVSRALDETTGQQPIAVPLGPLPISVAVPRRVKVDVPTLGGLKTVEIEPLPTATGALVSASVGTGVLRTGQQVLRQSAFARAPREVVQIGTPRTIEVSPGQFVTRFRGGGVGETGTLFFRTTPTDAFSRFVLGSKPIEQVFRGTRTISLQGPEIALVSYKGNLINIGRGVQNVPVPLRARGPVEIDVFSQGQLPVTETRIIGTMADVGQTPFTTGILRGKLTGTAGGQRVSIPIQETFLQRTIPKFVKGGAVPSDTVAIQFAGQPRSFDFVKQFAFPRERAVIRNDPSTSELFVRRTQTELLPARLEVSGQPFQPSPLSVTRVQRFADTVQSPPKIGTRLGPTVQPKSPAPSIRQDLIRQVKTKPFDLKVSPQQEALLRAKAQAARLRDVRALTEGRGVKIDKSLREAQLQFADEVTLKSLESKKASVIRELISRAGSKTTARPSIPSPSAQRIEGSALDLGLRAGQSGLAKAIRGRTVAVTETEQALLPVFAPAGVSKLAGIVVPVTRTLPLFGIAGVSVSPAQTERVLNIEGTRTVLGDRTTTRDLLQTTIQQITPIQTPRQDILPVTAITTIPIERQKEITIPAVSTITATTTPAIPTVPPILTGFPPSTTFRGPGILLPFGGFPSPPETGRPPAGVSRGSEQGFDVYIKQKGKFVKANKPNLSLTAIDAIKFGTYVADNTVPRSVVVRPSVKPVSKPAASVPDVRYKFRAPVRTSAFPRGTYTEQTRYAIDTVGEKRGLSVARFLSSARKLLPNVKLDRTMKMLKRNKGINMHKLRRK